MMDANPFIQGDVYPYISSNKGYLGGCQETIDEEDFRKHPFTSTHVVIAATWRFLGGLFLSRDEAAGFWYLSNIAQSISI
jgi:hypothetical protein